MARKENTEFELRGITRQQRHGPDGRFLFERLRHANDEDHRVTQ